jgi:NADPH2:quinone reductase
MAGMLSEQWLIPDFAPMEFIPAAIKLTIYDSGQLQIPKEYFQDFLKDIESGRVSPVIGNVFSLNEIVAAHQLMDSNNAGGKIVVTVN